MPPKNPRSLPRLFFSGPRIYNSIPSGFSLSSCYTSFRSFLLKHLYEFSFDLVSHSSAPFESLLFLHSLPSYSLPCTSSYYYLILSMFLFNALVSIYLRIILIKRLLPETNRFVVVTISPCLSFYPCSLVIIVHDVLFTCYNCHVS